MKPIAIAIHGGAGTILKSTMTPEKEVHYLNALDTAISVAYEILLEGGTSLEAVEAAVMELEDSPFFNAGKGSVFTNLGKHEMDASIMEGRNQKAGSVAGIRNVRNPVQLARAVMEESEYVMLCADGAEEFARRMHIGFEEDAYFFDQHRYDQWIEIRDSEKTMLDHAAKKFGTVGAVALDCHGDLAAATSTGGMTNKRFGRIGDSPVIGAGTYANNKTCAVSCTGHGEYFMRAVVAYDISCLMEYKGLTLKQACDFVVFDKLKKSGGEGGLIALDAAGNIELVFNSEGMYRGWKTSDDDYGIKIYGE
ncbi:MAG: isoaspartyl peptidase/L-asparaginase [Bacteroidetes bacterium]|nr:isoaspartyl peptidase/L-asparaginase [Bacteroidota bacterium]